MYQQGCDDDYIGRLSLNISTKTFIGILAQIDTQCLILIVNNCSVD